MINCILPENLFIRNDDKIVALQFASLLFFNINKIILDITQDLNHCVQNCLVYPYSRKLEPWKKTLFSISHSLVSVTVFNSAKQLTTVFISYISIMIGLFLICKVIETLKVKPWL